ncbi:putative quinol monooxygenase [Kineococcus sp. NPDC059986]|jgi:quinol monooxygenase YgiN|uniref:putative quinol monooxygenase n=1 Tax=Kineococcus sp. NPDC059986 TaxID=3155538 RepID=UPI00344EB4BE
MILIVVKWPVKPELSDRWPELVKEFTDAVRAEPGNLFFDWSRGVEDPNLWTLVEGFRDDEAGRTHVASDHFQKAISEMPDHVAAQPQIIYVEAPDVAGFGPMGEVQPR